MANTVEVIKLSGVFGGPQAQEFRQTISELVQGGLKPYCWIVVRSPSLIVLA